LGFWVGIFCGIYILSDMPFVRLLCRKYNWKIAQIVPFDFGLVKIICSMARLILIAELAKGTDQTVRHRAYKDRDARGAGTAGAGARRILKKHALATLHCVSASKNRFGPVTNPAPASKI
jgi:hypothetical protein